MKGKPTREDIAAEEVGHTQISPAVARLMVAAFLVVILCVPAIQTWVEWRRSSFREIGVLQMGSLTPKTENLATFKLLEVLPSSEQISAFEKSVEDTSLLRVWTLEPAQRVLSALGVGNEQVLLGKGDWLFYRGDVDYVTGKGFLEPSVLKRRSQGGSEWRRPPQPDPVPAILQFKRQLAARGIQLLVVPTPVKPSLYPEQLSFKFSANHPPVENPSYGHFLQRLRDEGVSVLDLGAHLSQKKADKKNLYLRGDTHWTPLGMELGAQAIAEQLMLLGIESKPVTTPAEVPGVEVENVGDIALMLYPSLASRSEGAGETVVVRRGNSQFTPAEQNSAEVLLLGDSFSNIYAMEDLGWGTDAGLATRLSAQLGQPVDTITINDNGAYSTRQQLSRELASGVDRLGGKKVVVYQFANRELAQGDWKMLPMELGKPKEIREQPVTLKGIVEAIARVPRPGTVPYRDAVAALALGSPEASDGSNFHRPVVVFAWAMKDNRLTSFDGFRVGQSLEMTLTPWRRKVADVGSYQRVELDDPRYLDAELFWWDQVEITSPVNVASKPEREPLAVVDEVSDVVPKSAMVKAEPKGDGSDFRTSLKRALEQLNESGPNLWQGREDWLFFKPEFRSLSQGPFWGDSAAKTTRAADPRFGDPLPAILDFHAQLHGAGISLILVPVPAKVAIYPEKAFAAGEAVTTYEQSSPHLETFYDLLAGQGVQILNLGPSFWEGRDEEQLFLKGDTHWSPAGIQKAASLIAEQLKQKISFEHLEKHPMKLESRDITLVGDLAQRLPAARQSSETVSLQIVVDSKSGRPLEPWRESPVLLMGDSHTLVFHAGRDLFALGAGLPDLLAFELGFPIDLIGVRGSGATPARLNLMRRRDNLAGKRVVVWCFTVREFTESTQGWRKVPVIRN